MIENSYQRYIIYRSTDKLRVFAVIICEVCDLKTTIFEFES